MNDDSLWHCNIDCECSAHSIRVWYVHNPLDGMDEREGGVDIWYDASMAPDNGLWDRVKLAWHVLWSGRIYIDGVLMKSDSMRELAKTLEDVASRMEVPDAQGMQPCRNVQNDD